MDKQLPRGVWFEAKYNRYRVRLYRYKRAFLKGYFKEEADALTGLAELQDYLAKLTKDDVAKLTMSAAEQGKVIVGSFKDQVGAVKL